MIYLMYKSAKFGLVLTVTYLQIYIYIYIYIGDVKVSLEGRCMFRVITVDMT